MIIWGKNMNNKILIGSIIAVTVLIGVSFTSVVGYGSIESDIKASPLFNIRSNRATDEESKDLSCEYVGKGEKSILLIPKREGRTASFYKVKRFIDIIIKMDDKKFNWFKGFIISRMKQNKLSDFNNKEIVNELNQLRNNQEVRDILLLNANSPQRPSIDTPCTPYDPKPGCLLLNLIIIIFLLIINFIDELIHFTQFSYCIICR